MRLASDIDTEGPKSREAFSKAKVFIRCFVKMLASCGSKHKNYIAKHENALEKTVQGLVDDLGELIILNKDAYPKECEELIRCILPLMNSNSVIPAHLKSSINQCWLTIPDHTTSLTFIQYMLNNASQLIASPELLSDVIENSLEAFFSDFGDDEDQSSIQRNASAASWNTILPMIKLPNDKEKYRKCLDQALQNGNCLILYSSLRLTRSTCTSIKDEQVLLISTLLDWFRHLELNEKSERKLPLLLREFVVLCGRQLLCGTSEPVVVQYLQEFMEVIAPLLENDGSKWNILGVLGFSSKYNPPPRLKFLALALTLYLQRCLLTGQKGPRIRLKR